MQTIVIYITLIGTTAVETDEKLEKDLNRFHN